MDDEEEYVDPLLREIIKWDLQDDVTPIIWGAIVDKGWTKGQAITPRHQYTEDEILEMSDYHIMLFVDVLGLRKEVWELVNNVITRRSK